MQRGRGGRALKLCFALRPNSWGTTVSSSPPALVQDVIDDPYASPPSHVFTKHVMPQPQTGVVDVIGRAMMGCNL